MIKFSALKYGQIFTIPVDPMNLWVKVPVIDKPDGGSPNVTTWEMANAILITGTVGADVFEMFADEQDCQVVAIEFEEDETATEPTFTADIDMTKMKDKEDIKNTIDECD